MKICNLLITFLLATCLSLGSAAGLPSVTKEFRQVRFAARVVSTELTRALSPSVRHARESCSLACDETGAMELAIGLIGATQGEVAAQTLINLLALRLDGAGSEELSCQILTRGKPILRRLERLPLAEVVSQCQTGFMDLRKRELAQISDVSVDQVCRSEHEIRVIRDELTKAIKSKFSCQ